MPLGHMREHAPWRLGRGCNHRSAAPMHILEPAPGGFPPSQKLCTIYGKVGLKCPSVRIYGARIESSRVMYSMLGLLAPVSPRAGVIFCKLGADQLNFL
jgi:hypothetical protein